jgi:hypothetical protein
MSFPEVRVWPNDQIVSILHLPVNTLSYITASTPTSIVDTKKKEKTARDTQNHKTDCLEKLKAHLAFPSTDTDCGNAF